MTRVKVARKVEPVTIADKLVKCAVEKKARALRLLDVSELTDYTNYILIMTATSDRHAKALADHILEQLRPDKLRPLGVEGYGQGKWILLDFGDVIVHIFQEATRLYYDLEGLWQEAEEIEIEQDQ